ncbi:hypothetical protein FQR65_LT14355 [Abscondita terminalis]|nr:hypothetical protein FQR65_LT14355 [Abscondita terminalis]
MEEVKETPPDISRKRKYSPEKWKKNVAKKLRYASKGEPVYPTCNHKTKRYLCSTLSCEEVQRFHEVFYSVPDKTVQDNFILKYVSACPIQRVRNPNSKTHRALAATYYILKVQGGPHFNSDVNNPKNVDELLIKHYGQEWMDQYVQLNLQIYKTILRQQQYARGTEDEGGDEDLPEELLCSPVQGEPHFNSDVNNPKNVDELLIKHYGQEWMDQYVQLNLQIYKTILRQQQYARGTEDEGGDEDLPEELLCSPDTMVRPKITKSMNALIDRLIKNPKILDKVLCKFFSCFKPTTSWNNCHTKYLKFITYKYITNLFKANDNKLLLKLKHEETAEEFLFNERSKWDQLEDTYIQYNPITKELTTFILPSLINSDDEETDIDLDTDDDEDNGSNDDENMDEIDDTTTSRPSISYIKTKRSISAAQSSTPSKKLKLGKNTSKYTTDISSESETEALITHFNKITKLY